MLDSFIKHIKDSNNQSLITRIYGAFTIKTNIFSPVDIVIMQNITYKKGDGDYCLTFDLKGNTKNRKVGPKKYKKNKFWK